MKHFLLSLFILASAVPLWANSPIQNGNFSAGTAQWQGDGVAPADYAKNNPSAATDPFTSKGLIVTLNPQAWTRIYQAFDSDKGTHYSIVVTYKLSPGITVSSKAADYQQIGKHINVPGTEQFGTINGQPGEFYGTIGDLSSNGIAMEVFSPNLKSSDVQTYQHTYPPISPSGQKTIAIAFPPGTGTVVILSVAATSS